MRFLTGHERPRDEVVGQWLPHMTDPALDAQGLGYWVGYADDAPLGWWCLTRRGDTHDEEEPATGWLGYRLLRSAWGQGYATEGAAALLEHGSAVGPSRSPASSVSTSVDITSSSWV